MSLCNRIGRENKKQFPNVLSKSIEQGEKQKTIPNISLQVNRIGAAAYMKAAMARNPSKSPLGEKSVSKWGGVGRGRANMSSSWVVKNVGNLCKKIVWQNRMAKSVKNPDDEWDDEMGARPLPTHRPKIPKKQRKQRKNSENTEKIAKKVEKYVKIPKKCYDIFMEGDVEDTGDLFIDRRYSFSLTVAKQREKGLQIVKIEDIVDLFIERLADKQIHEFLSNCRKIERKTGL